MKVEFFKHNINENDIANVSNVLRSTFLTTGDVVTEFETKFASYLGVKHAIGVTSCTAALHLSLLAYDIGEGDEVITTPMSFCATSNAILHTGAIPVFVDVEEDTGNINAELIENKITNKTKAIIPVHLYGQMCDMKKIRQIADKYNLVVIEDAAHCMEGSRDDIRVGQLGDTACFSFYTTKSITAGESGTIATNNTNKVRLIRILGLHGIDKIAIQRYRGGPSEKTPYYDMPILGWKYNMNNIQAALLLGQLGRINQFWMRRTVIWNKYKKAFKNIKEIKLLKTYYDTIHARHLFTILVDSNKRDLIIYKLQKRDIGTTINYKPIHLFTDYKNPDLLVKKFLTLVARRRARPLSV